MNKACIVVFVFLVFGCNRVSELQQKKMTGVNDEAIYVLNEDGSVANVFKEIYSTPDFTILLYADTIEAGTEFVSLIHVSSSQYRVAISSPTQSLILSDGSSEPKKYRFKPNEIGMYNYRGVIEYDTVLVPFEYKFIVVAQE